MKAKTIKIKCKAAATVPIEKLSEFQGDIKTLSKESAKKLRRSIWRYGFTAPIFVWMHGEKRDIIDGHQRLTVLRQLQAEGIIIPPIPVAYIEAKTKAEAKRRLLLITSSYGKFKKSGLQRYLDSMKASIDEIAKEVEIPEIELLKVAIDRSDLDNIPATKKSPKTKEGEIFLLGNHRLMCGDSESQDDISILVGSDGVDLLLTDPPYGVNYSEKNKFLNEMDGGSRIQKEISGDSIPIGDIKESWKTVFGLSFSVMREGSSFYVFAPPGIPLVEMLSVLNDLGFPVRHSLVWAKNNHVFGRCDYNYRHEMILYGWKKKHKFNGKGEQKTSVWNYDKPQVNDLHPTMKPVAMLENAIMNSSKEGDTVLDPFGGSGSTLIACEHRNRKCLMMEIDRSYCDVIIRRWEDFTGKKAKKIKTGGTK